MNQQVETHAPSRDGVMEDVCEHCAFSNFAATGDTGDCRANPPTPLVVPEQQQDIQSGRMMLVPMIRSVFPPVMRRTFCHTFEPRNDIVEG